MKKFILGALLLLCACKPTSTDNYTFETKNYTNNRIDVFIVEHNDLADIKRSYDKEAGNKSIVDGDHQLMAYSSLGRKPDGTATCKIHIVDPYNKYYPEYMGHELAHCIYGQFHPNQQ